MFQNLEIGGAAVVSRDRTATNLNRKRRIKLGLLAIWGFEILRAKKSYFSLRDLGTGQYNTFFFFSPLLPSGLSGQRTRRAIDNIPS